MVVLEIDIQGGFARPAEGDPVIPGNAHRPALRVASQSMEAKSCDVHVLGLPRYFQQLHDAHALPDMVATDPACLAGEVNLLKPFMSEAADHSFTVNVLVYSVNRTVITGSQLVRVVLARPSNTAATHAQLTYPKRRSRSSGSASQTRRASEA